MTAIAGFWSFDERPDALVQCRAMLAAQRHYGSRSPSDARIGRLACGLTLYHLLPEDAHDRQPLLSPDGRHALVADVRLDNRDELGTALGLSRAESADLADSDLLFRALLRFESAALDKVVGDYAFAFFDARARRLLLGRDPLGQRPLFWHRGKDFIAFASMPKGLHAVDAVPASPSSESVARYLGLLSQQGSSSFYANIQRVRPGHVTELSPAKTVERRHWTPGRRELMLKSFDDYVEAFRFHLDQAVACRLRRLDGPVATHLSGGWDSSAVTATAARLLAEEGEVVAFTSVPPRGETGTAPGTRFADEGPLAAATARLYPNVEHVQLESPNRSPVQGLADYIGWFDRPPFNPCNHPWLADIRTAARARGARVLLTGEIGNWTISASPNTLLADLVRQRRWREWRRQARAMLQDRRARVRGIAVSSFGPWLPRPLLAAASHFSSGAKRELHDALHPGLAAGLRREQAGQDHALMHAKSYFDTAIQAYCDMDFGEYRKGILGGWGIDKRDATADRRLVEFCLSLPLEMLLSDGERRPLAKAALADRLPAEVLEERRKGYQNASWGQALSADRAEAERLVEDIAGDPLAAEIIDVDLLRTLLREWPEGGWDDWRVIARYRGAFLRALTAGQFILNSKA